ncbi:MAG: radical SAM protein [Bacteroidales bacterium]|nr:radical SAM protein [Bacteroidales bacterium]
MQKFFFISAMLFDKIIFGPVHSRRLGRSLGINLLPETVKVCSMNCIYCECGWGRGEDALFSKFLPYEEIISVLRERFQQMRCERVEIDSITYSGNGEPTIHPQFAKINQSLIELRNTYFSGTIITCLSNSTQLHRNDVLEALKTIDNPLMKLDAGTQSVFELINKPFSHLSLDVITDNLRKFNGKLSIQTLFLRGTLDDGTIVDNTTEKEVDMWLERLKSINPHTVILYPIDRKTPAKQLEKIDKETLNSIAQRVQACGMKTIVSG